MTSYPNAEVLSLIKELVSKLTNFKDGSNLFNHIENYVITCIHNSDSMFFLKKKDIDRAIASLSDKFIFHGFSIQANDLVRHYENFLPNSTPKSECETKLNVIKFLLCLAESPTKNFLENPDGYSTIVHEEEIDWPTYLKEGIERWSPAPAESSDIWSDDSNSDISLNESPDVTDSASKVIENKKFDVKEPSILNYNQQKRILLGLIQNGWFFKDRVCMLPESTNIDANIAICWDDFIEYSVRGLIPVKRSTIISEYCVLREIIWQCYVLHNSCTYHFVKNQLLPKENVTIASVRPMALNTFLHEFLSYIELLEEFRSFRELLFDDNQLPQAPDTYRSYNKSLLNFTKPLFSELVNLEKEILAQETTMTLLKLANHFKGLFHNALILKEIHQSVVLDFKKNDSVKCATTLLSRLHIRLLHCVSKTELDIYLTLYLESLFKYLRIINVWLGNDTLIDLHDEFIVKHNTNSTISSADVADTSSYISVMTENIINYDHCDWQMGFTVKELDESCKDDSVFKLISTDVLQIGKNIHFLRLLKKLYLLGDTLNTESLYEELINRVLKEISSYFNYEEDTPQDEVITLDEELPYKSQAICPDYCKYPTEMDRLENLVDTSDGFLMIAFRSFFTEQPKQELPKDETLYEKISKITKNIYPAKQIIDRVFSQILQERYNESGYLVKNLLIVDFQMQKHIDLLRHLFLFKDDLIFLLYRRLFEQMEDHKRFDSDIWLTTQLHDILIDPYPDFYEKCIVKVDDITQTFQDPLRACELINVCYSVNWPVNLIIREEHLDMYSELFQLILKIKWALYTLNHLYFTEIEPETSKVQRSKAAVHFIRRLKLFRFHLLNEFSNIQHYILGYVFNKFLKKFEKDFEGAFNLDTLIASHFNFINSVYKTSMYFRDLNDKSHGFNLLLYIVRKFHIMWKNVKNIDEKELLKCEIMFRKCHDNLNPIMFPRDMIMDV